jgi:hypothetical protein
LAVWRDQKRRPRRSSCSYYPTTRRWVVKAVADNDGKQRQKQASPWKTFAFFSGATLQLAVCVVVFGYLGQRLAVHWHHPWITAVGVLFGVLVGASGLTFLAKQVLGDKL